MGGDVFGINTRNGDIHAPWVGASAGLYQDGASAVAGLVILAEQGRAYALTGRYDGTDAVPKYTSSGLYQATFSEGAWSTWTLVETTEVIRTCPQGPNMRIFGHVMAHEKTVGDTDSLLIATYDGKLMRGAVPIHEASTPPGLYRLPLKPDTYAPEGPPVHVHGPGGRQRRHLRDHHQ